jgi:biotin carboxyl carrier protein
MTTRQSRFVAKCSAIWGASPRYRCIRAVLREVSSFPSAGDEAVKGGFIAPMPGKVVKVHVSAGDTVTRGQPLLVLEAMKMEQTTLSPDDGVVNQVLVREGDQVTAGQVLIRLGSD